jgi:hypothetical protein
MMPRLSLGLLLALLPAGAVAEQPASVLPGAPTARRAPAAPLVADDELLGGKFESRAAGIGMRTPAGFDEIRRAGLDTLVEYVDDKRAMVLTLSKVSLQYARPLGDAVNARGQKELGILSATIDDFVHQHQDAEVLRKDQVNIADADVGVFALRFYQGKKRRLLQQAMIRRSDSVYYVLTLASGASEDKGIPEDASKGNPEERYAVALFRQVLDSVKLLDVAPIRKEQEQRLESTREVLPVLKDVQRMKGALRAEQYYRLVRDGKDIGYTCIFEEVARRDGREGVMVSVRAKTAIDKAQASVLSQMFLSFDWRNESWTHAAQTSVEGRQNQTSELGVSNLTTRAVVDRSAPTTQIGAQPGIVEVDDHKLEVRSTFQRSSDKGPMTATGQPKNFPLPPWYLPQAAKQMLPRLLPLDKAEEYLFATYVSEQREVMARYIDVGTPANVNFAGRSVHATPIYDKTGLEGAVTIHYVGEGGVYFGSTTTYTGARPTENSTLELIATDVASLQRAFPGADFSKPREIDIARLR